ncbi:MAG: hypothetical protein JG777_2523 [Clostridia bacterium]|nr:hypothetical protein [Clostridia bacterium]
MFFYKILLYGSVIKNKLYCNCNKIIYFKNNCVTPTVLPKINVRYKVISDTHELEVYSNKSEILKKNIKLNYYLEKGCKLYLAMYEDYIVGYYLICKLNEFRPYLYNYHYIFDGNCAYYIFYCHTLFKYRGKGIYPYMLSKICEEHCNDNVIFYISASLNNLSSQKGIEKAGFFKKGILKNYFIGHVAISNRNRD